MLTAGSPAHAIRADRIDFSQMRGNRRRIRSAQSRHVFRHVPVLDDMSACGRNACSRQRRTISWPHGKRQDAHALVENPEGRAGNGARDCGDVIRRVPRIGRSLFGSADPRARRAGCNPSTTKLAPTGSAYKAAAYGGAKAGFPLHLVIDSVRRSRVDNISKAIGCTRAPAITEPRRPRRICMRWYMALGLEMVEVWGQAPEAADLDQPNPIGPHQAGLVGAVPGRITRSSFTGGRLKSWCGSRRFMATSTSRKKNAETLRDGLAAHRTSATQSTMRDISTSPTA